MKHDFYPKCINCNSAFRVDFDKIDEPVICEACNYVYNAPAVKLLIANDLECLERGINFQSFESIQYVLNIHHHASKYLPSVANFTSNIIRQYTISKIYDAPSLATCFGYIEPFVLTLNECNLFSFTSKEESERITNILTTSIIEPAKDLLPFRLMEKFANCEYVSIDKKIETLVGHLNEELKFELELTMFLVKN